MFYVPSGLEQKCMVGNRRDPNYYGSHLGILRNLGPLRTQHSFGVISRDRQPQGAYGLHN